MTGTVALGSDAMDNLGTPRRNGAKHWTARRGNEARVPGSWEPKVLRVAPGDDVLDELQSRRHQMASWPKYSQLRKRDWEAVG